MKRKRDHEWWRLLGCGLPFVPLLFLAVPVFFVGVHVMAATERRGRVTA